MTLRPIGASWSLLVVLVAPAAARAETNGASAEALFVQGRAALEAGRYEDACSKLDASERLEPAAGTLLNLGECEEKRGRVASAWEALRHALELLPASDDRRAFAEKRAAALERRLPRLAITIAKGAPKGARAMRDGTELPPGSDGVSLPVDPGPHEVKLLALGGAHATTVNLAEGESRVVVLDVTAAPVASGVRADAAERPNRVGPLPLVTGGGALVALTLGVAGGLAASGRNATMNDHCTADRVCDPVGLDAGRDGRTYATVSTVSFVAAGALAAATVYLVLRGR